MKPHSKRFRGFSLECPGCGGDIRLIALITEPGTIRKTSRLAANRSSRLRFLPPAARRPTGVSSCRPTAFKRHPTNYLRSIATASESS